MASNCESCMNYEYDEEYEYYEAYFDFEEIEDGVYGMIEGNSELSSG